MIKKFASVTLWVNDFEKAIQFYRDILGLELLTAPGEIPQFEIGDGLLVLVKGKYNSPSDAFPPDFPQFSLEVDDLDQVVAQLRSKNHPISGNIEERRDAFLLTLYDPDENLIELVELKK